MAIDWNKVSQAQGRLAELARLGGTEAGVLAARLEASPEVAAEVLFEANRALVRLSRSSVAIPGINRFAQKAPGLTREQLVFVNHLIGISDPTVGERGDKVMSIADQLKGIA